MRHPIARLIVMSTVMGALVVSPSQVYRTAASAAVDTPTVSVAPDIGELATGRGGLLAAAGYVEKEFFLEGTARSYASRGNWTLDGVWTAVSADGAPYKVRILVRYPTDPARFNGLVFVEWLNVSGQTEADPLFSLLQVELLREGYAYAGVGAQNVGIHGSRGLKTLNTARYGALHHPGDSFSYDIYSQTGQAIRTPRDQAPLGDLTQRIRALIAAGESQSASRMVTYVNAVHPLAHVYDGFFVHSRSGGGAPLAQDAENRPTIPVPNPARVRSDLKVPVFQVQAETDVPNFVGARQPDNDRVRTWELAGTAHGDRYLLTGGGVRPLTMTCDDSDPKLSVPINDGPMTYPMRAALRHLRRWVAAGSVPPTATPISTDGQGIRRDPATGIALGGVRTPHVDVPVRTLNGVREPAGGGGFCRLFGRTDEWNGDADPWDGGPADPSPTPEPVLSKLYPTKSAFVSLFADALEKSIGAGFLLREDAAAMSAEAAGVSVEERTSRKK